MTSTRAPKAGEDRDAPPALSRGRFHLVMAVLLLVEVLSSLEHNMVVTAIPTIAREFGGLTSAGWLVTAFLLVQAATAAIGGRLGDLFGRRRVLAILIALCVVGSAISALGQSMEVIVAGRVIQGASGAILPLCYGITREVAPKAQVPLWIGVLTGGYAFSAAFGYILSGVMVDLGDWRGVFYLTAFYGAAVLPLLLIVVPAVRGTGPAHRLDVIGAALFAPAIAMVLYGITTASKTGWDQPQTWLFIGGGLAAMALWVWHELHHPEPLIEVRLLARREVALGIGSAALASFGLSQLPLVTLMFMQQPLATGVGLGVGGAVAGLLKLPSNISALVGAPLSGWISGRHGSRVAVIQGALIGAAGWIALYFLHDSLAQTVAFTIVCAFGMAMLLSGMPNLVLEGTPYERSSETTGLLQVVRATFSAIGAQTMTILLSTSRVVDAKGVSHPSEAAYQLTFATIAAASLGVAALCLLFGRRRPGERAA